MEKSVINKKAEISNLLKEFKELFDLHSDKISEYLKKEYYFSELEDMLNDKDENDFNSLKFSHCDLPTEFRQFIIKYDIRHDEIKESTLDKIIKVSPHYILHEKPMNNSKEKPVNNDLKEEPINNDLKEELINNNFKKQPIINIFKKSIISNLKKQPKINNLKEKINNLKKRPITNNLKEKNINLKKQSIINNLKENFSNQ